MINQRPVCQIMKKPKQINEMVRLKDLEACIGQDTFLYLLRRLYRVVFVASALQENKAQLQRRIERFEMQSRLPEAFSLISLDALLAWLEDCQYLYPLSFRETALPQFFD